MDNAGAMRCRQCICNLNRDVQALFVSQLSVRIRSSRKFTLDKLCHDYQIRVASRISRIVMMFG